MNSIVERHSLWAFYTALFCIRQFSQTKTGGFVIPFPGLTEGSVGSDGCQRVSKLHKHGTEERDLFRFQPAGDGVRQGGDCRSQITGVHIPSLLPFSLCAPGVRGHGKGESVSQSLLSFISCGNCLCPALQFFPYTGRRKALTLLSKTEKHIVVIVIFHERVFHNIVFHEWL